MYSEVSKNRTEIMGIAMLMVLFFHFFMWVYNPIGRFNIGYVGVDIFLFLSGIGLASSYEKNSIRRFYRNRINRLYPIYFIALCLTWLIFPFNWNISDFINNALTIGFYLNGGENRYDWYVESLFTLYLLFPLFYRLGKLRYYGLVIVFIATTVILRLTYLQWWYDCLIGRLPIFLYGIMFKHLSIRSFLIIGLLGLVLYIPCFKISAFLASSLLVPALIFVSIKIINVQCLWLKHSMSYLGEKSLEIYLSNLFVYWTFQVYDIGSVMTRAVLYLVIQSVVSFILIRINICVQNKLNYKKSLRPF